MRSTKWPSSGTQNTKIRYIKKYKMKIMYKNKIYQTKCQAVITLIGTNCLEITQI
jgi:hypothetical protein